MVSAAINDKQPFHDQSSADEADAHQGCWHTTTNNNNNFDSNNNSDSNFMCSTPAGPAPDKQQPRQG